ncbi:MAG: hypothetical protein CMM45_01735 [Rhodospirillaceae bacterium]|nr:hypothetical protein [Rhodospirillaceae bacterium]
MKMVDVMNDLAQARFELLNSSIFQPNSIKSIAGLRTLMEHHVFAVWDFMSLVKALQREVAPAPAAWLPPCDSEGARMINEIVLCEESDYGPDGHNTLSHFELYLDAMREVGADTSQVETFLGSVGQMGVDKALDEASLPVSIDQFVRHTFDVIRSNKPWVVCAAFAFGRESIIPDMFQRLRRSEVMKNCDCPAFDYYLARHIEVDGGVEDTPGHGELALRLLDRLCDDNADRHAEAEHTGIQALRVRTRFWLGVSEQLDIKTAA